MKRLLPALLLPLLWLAALAWAAPTADGGVQPVPALNAPVTDQAGLLKTDQKQALELKLLAFEQQKGSQIAVLIVPTTQPEDIFSYSFRVADHWKLGRKGVDDGVLFVIATQDRKTNLQIGYGLEGAIPDITSKQILQDIVRPHFQQGDFYGGIDAGVDTLIKAASGEALPLPAPRQQAGQQGGGFVPALIIGGIVAFILQFMLGKVFGGLAGGAVGATVAAFLGASLLVALFTGIGVAILLWLGMAGGGPFGFMGGGGGFGGGSFGGGGGGWSGGGGGFGGGGASGDW